MGMGQITYMDVVANARPIIGRIVVSENLHLRSLTGRCLKNNWNQVCLRIMLFATQLRRPCGVEIAEAHESQAVGLLVPMAGPLKSKFRLAIRICGTRGVRFINEGFL